MDESIPEQPSQELNADRLDALFESYGAKRLDWALKTADLSLPEVSRRAFCDDSEKLRRLRKGGPKGLKPSRGNLFAVAQAYAPELGKAQDNEGLSDAELAEIDLNLYFGLLPRQLGDLDEDQRGLLLAAIRHIVHTTCLLSRHPESQDLLRYWLQSTRKVAAGWHSLASLRWWVNKNLPEDIDHIWRSMDHDRDDLTDLQRGFAAALRARILALGGMHREAEAIIGYAESTFPREISDPQSSPTRILRRELFKIKGDVHREAGHADDAREDYDRALTYTREAAERLQIRRRAFNACLRAGKFPDASELQALEGAINRSLFEGKQIEPGPIEYASTCHAIAWFYRSQGLGNTPKALEWNNKGIDRLDTMGKSDDPEFQRQRAIGKTYHAETLLRMGRFNDAADELRNLHFEEPHKVRDASRHYLFARSLAYLALDQGSIDQLNHAIAEFEEAEVLFSAMPSLQRREQNLNELAKFYAVRTFCRSGEADGGDWGKAIRCIRIAKSILKELGTFKDFDMPAILINEYVIEFLRWMSSPAKRNRKDGEQLHEKLERHFEPLKSTTYSGHQARICALLAAIEMVQDIDRRPLKARQEQIKTNIANSARKSRLWDYMALHDCRFWISLGEAAAESTVLEGFGVKNGAVEWFDKDSDWALKGKPSSLQRHAR